MQARGRYVSGPSALLGTAALAAAISFSSGAIAQSVSAQAAAAAAAPAQASAPAQAPAASSGTLPAVNVNAEKPQQKPAQRQVKRQGPNREPIKIPVNASGCKSVRAPGKPYFVEFRSRTAVSYGHTFVVHGRLGEGNRYASYQIAGLHPKGDDPNVYMQGMMVPVESETGPSWGDEDEQYLTARFCVTLTEAEYRKALAYIKTLQATKKTWHATTYNCNAFAADIARHIGLDSPNPNMYLPQAFITRMADLNKGGKPNNPFAANFSGFQQAPATQPQRRAPVQRTAQPRQTQQPTQQ
ncbi:hypothetical protein [Pseudorhodoplanes sp.]|uniref:hypothetical protein n=1 Tax=Pseudorhodoplanes sp. TaxID=1934341 RepID=UPI002C7044BB|nr:hypothetical protein [Pseudorhodoplanes sp.]HWV52078.1 hypothetical protein [Pseudorhodoplanes sp.]